MRRKNHLQQLNYWKRLTEVHEGFCKKNCEELQKERERQAFENKDQHGMVLWVVITVQFQYTYEQKHQHNVSISLHTLLFFASYSRVLFWSNRFLRLISFWTIYPVNTPTQNQHCAS